MSIVDVGGSLVAYTDTGPQSAPTVMFGPGLLFGDWMFRAQINELSTTYRCITLDWRGQGESPPGSGRPGIEDYGMDALATDAGDLIRTLGVGPVHWVGLSMGGFVGQRLAVRHPNLVRSLTLLNTTDKAAEPSQVTDFKRLAVLQQLLPARALVKLAGPVMFGPTFLSASASKVVLEEWTSWLANRNRRTLRRAVLAVALRDSFEENVSSITAPTLVVGGVDDKGIPSGHAESLVSRIKGARLLVVPDCGHLSCIEQPELITAALSEFIAGVDGRAAQPLPL